METNPTLTEPGIKYFLREMFTVGGGGRVDGQNWSIIFWSTF